MSQTLTVTGKTIKSAVIRKIVQKFPNITVYKETVNEGIKYPYFMVYCEDFTQEKLMRENYLQTFIISVLYQYKALPETSYSSFEEVGYQLADILSTITLEDGKPLRGYSINWYPDDQKLEFYVNYDIKVAREQQAKPKQMTRKVNVYKK